MKIDIGKMDGESHGFKKALPVTLEIELKQENKGEVLSICGNVWRPNKTDIVAGGQCQDTIRDALNHGRLELAEGQTRNEIYKLLDIWDTWHLNGMNAACSHQRVVIKEMEETHGKKFFYADNYDEIVKLPFFAKCPDCGYRYGSAWLYEPLPADVTEFITGFIAGPPAPSPDAEFDAFLKDNDISVKIEGPFGNICPRWCDGKHMHGKHYIFTFTRGGKQATVFSFWNSYKDMQEGKNPAAKDLICAVQKDDPGTFEDFCSDFGYDTDSIKAEATYDAVTEEYKRVTGFFTPEELEGL